MQGTRSVKTCLTFSFPLSLYAVQTQFLITDLFILAEHVRSVKQYMSELKSQHYGLLYKYDCITSIFKISLMQVQPLLASYLLISNNLNQAIEQKAFAY